MLEGMRTGTLITAIATIGMMLVSGCSTALGADPPAPAARHAPVASGTSYWNRSRLLGARPFFGTGHLGPLPGQTPDARPAVIALKVGALFEQDASGAHFCTASVVASPGLNLLITAAHCINSGNGNGYRQDIVFIPGYRDGTAPYGIWTTRRLLVAPQWAQSADPDYDVGFVVLNPLNGENIQTVLGANQLGSDTGYQYLVKVTGYPSSADAPITCVNWTSKESDTQLEFDCGGYTDGTSGSPWVTDFDPSTDTGTIVGVIGGYQEGGDSPSVSYSPYFGSAVHQLYEQAISAS
jgi:V8-like Glu-specific endopeptidase